MGIFYCIKMEEEYNDNSLMMFGKYKFVALSRVPATYLLRLYANRNHPDKKLLKYIGDNILDIRSRLYRGERKEKVNFTCDKFIYLTESEAKIALNSMDRHGEDAKIPVRAYECDKCTGWHLTSIPLHEYKKNNK